MKMNMKMNEWMMRWIHTHTHYAGTMRSLMGEWKCTMINIGIFALRWCSSINIHLSSSMATIYNAGQWTQNGTNWNGHPTRLPPQQPPPLLNDALDENNWTTRFGEDVLPMAMGKWCGSTPDRNGLQFYYMSHNIYALYFNACMQYIGLLFSFLYVRVGWGQMSV